MLAQEIPSVFFKVLGAIFSLTVVLLWIVVSIGTIHQAIVGKLIFAPCIKDWEEREEKRENRNIGTETA